jgi:hypothetical protein
METIMFSSVLRNNQKYISNMFEMFESIEKKLGDEYKFKYLIYTNNNEDNTYKLLDEKKKENWKVINVDMDEDFLKKHKVEKLYSLRQNLLDEIKKEKFDYLLMFDSDIYFNSVMIVEILRKYKNNKFDALTTNTICQNNPLYYDFFSLVDENDKQIDKKNKIDTVNFHSRCFQELSFPVKSAFGGFFFISSKSLRKKNPNYLEVGQIDKNICEHVGFNKNFSIEFVSDVTPIRVKLDYDYKHKQALQNINSNKLDLRNSGYYITYLSTLLLSFALLTWLYFSRFRNYTKIYALLSLLIIINVYNFFEEIY